ncbi:MAG: hypothetical protein WDZ80_02480 [Candidatus Paceibacterota bacterium]
MLQSLEFWALVISLFAIGISLYTWYKSYAIEKDRRDDEERDQNSAVIRAYLKRLKEGMGTITIENIGKSEARNIEVKVDDITLLEHENVLNKKEKYQLIGPHSYIQYKISVSFDKPPVNFIEITWDDDYSKANSYRNSLSY